MPDNRSADAGEHASDNRSVGVRKAAPAADPAPQQVVEIVTAAIAEYTLSVEDLSDQREVLSEECEWCARESAQYVSALTAALDAYKREQQRQWLEERGVVAVRCGGMFTVDWSDAADERAVRRLENALSEVNGWRTADAARDAAAKALGYPGLGATRASGGGGNG